MYRLIIIACMLWNIQFQAIVIGTDSAASRQGFVVFSALDTNNEIRGFATIDNGFRLENSSASCIYNAWNAISGPIGINGGTLSLLEDMVCSGTIAFTTVGTIAGNGHSLRFTAQDAFTLPSGGANGRVLRYVVGRNMSAAIGEVAWTSDGKYVACGANKSLRVFSFDGALLTQLYSTTLATALNTLAWRYGSYFLASGREAGSNEFQLWYFDPTKNSLTQKDAKSFGSAVCAAAWSPDGNYLAVGTMRSLPTIIMYSFNQTTSLLTEVASYDFTPSATITVGALSWNATGEYLAVGFTSNAAAELVALSFNGSTLTLNAQLELGSDVRSLSYSPVLPLIAVGLATGSQRLRVYQHNPRDGTLVEKTSARVNESSAIVYALDWNAGGTQLVLGRNTSATGGEFRVYDFDARAVVFYLAAQLDSAIPFRSVRSRIDGRYFAAGSTTSSYFAVWRMPYEQLADGIIWGNLKIDIGADVMLNSTLTFTGTCCLDGGGNAISLGSTGAIIVDEGGSLLLRNVIINNVAGTNIRCLDAASSLSLENVILNLDADWTFTQGYLEIIGDVKYTGTNVFVYRTSQISTICANAEWYFDTGMTFSYDPLNGLPSRIAFQGNTSVLHLCDASMYVASCGLQLLKGTLMCEGVCYFMNSALGQSGGIIVGDGISATNNFQVAAMPKSGGIIMSGFLVNNNI